MNETMTSSGEEHSLTKNLKSKSIWLRLLFMVAITVIYSVSRVVVGAVIVAQFIWVLVTGDRNPKLLALGKSLGTYTNQVILYLTFYTEERPFPFDMDWPS